MRRSLSRAAAEIKDPGVPSDWGEMARFRVLLATLAALAPAPALSAELFQCVEGDGVPRFVDRRSACEAAEPYVLHGTLGGSGAANAHSAAELPGSPAPFERDLERLLLTAQEVGPGWEVVAEEPSKVEDDPDFVSWGVRAKQVRHYTRESRGFAQVCSIEIWRFHRLYDARLAAEHFSYPEWQIDREQEMLVMAHGITRAIEGDSRSSLFPDCIQLGERQRRKLAAMPAAKR